MASHCPLFNVRFAASIALILFMVINLEEQFFDNLEKFELPDTILFKIENIYKLKIKKIINKRISLIRKTTSLQNELKEINSLIQKGVKVDISTIIKLENEIEKISKIITYMQIRTEIIEKYLEKLEDERIRRLMEGR